MVLTVVSVTLDILCCKYRQIARLFFAMEMINQTLFHSLSFDLICDLEMVYLLLFFLTFFFAVCLVCDARLSLVILFVAACVQTAIRYYFLDLDSGKYYRYFFVYSMIGILIMIMASILNHVASLHMRLRVQVNEYFNLINRMREGVLVFVNEPLSEIKFCNKATEKIFDISSEK